MNKAIECMKKVFNPSKKFCRKFTKVSADKRENMLSERFKKCISKSGFEAELTAKDNEIQIEFFPNDNIVMPFNFVKTINGSFEAFAKEIVGKCDTNYPHIGE